MLKRILCTLCALIILIPLAVVPASANDTGFEIPSTDISNLWTYKSWEEYISKDYAKSLEIDKLREYSKKDICSVFRFDKNFISDSSFLKSSFWYLVDGEYYYSDSSLKDEANLNVSGDYCQYYSVSDKFGEWRNTEFSNLFSVSYNGTYSDNYCYIVDDIEVYKSLVTKFADNPCKDQIYYCEDIIQSFIDYIDYSGYDDMLYDVYPLKDGYKNIIRFYDSFDCYKWELGFNFYDDAMLNYLNSSLSLKTDLYYTTNSLSSNDNVNDFQHYENINLYIPVDDEFANSHLASELIDEYMAEVGYAVHFRDGLIPFNTWYNTYIKKYISSEPEIVRLKNVAPSSENNLTVNNTEMTKDCFFIRFQMPNQYSFIEGETGNGIMSGCRTMSTARLLDVSNGEINSGLNGVGSDIDGADYADNKDRDDLLADGWQNGYPNKLSYPYKITMNKNGEVLYEMYFDRKPNISSNFYTNEQIAYDVNLNLTKGYLYSKTYNCSYEFDFRTSKEDDLLSSDTLSSTIDNGIINNFEKLCSFFGISYNSSLTSEFVIRLWTNYTGQLTGVYRGYYVQFNWDLENDPNFIKNNSDDMHNYTDDFLGDEPITDNNGNIHGGAVDTPTESPDYNGFNNEDFSFDENNLWKYADSFLGFCARAFKILPSFIWQLIGCSIVIVIVLRIVGR